MEWVLTSCYSREEDIAILSNFQGTLVVSRTALVLIVDAVAETKKSVFKVTMSSKPVLVPTPFLPSSLPFLQHLVPSAKEKNDNNPYPPSKHK